MDARTWWKSRGTEKARAVVEAAGTNWDYFLHIAAGRKRPGADLARRLVEASDGEMTLEELLFPDYRAK